MELTSLHWLSALVALPLVGAIALLLVPSRQANVARGVALAWTSGIFVLSLGLLWVTDASVDGFQLAEEHEWLTALGASYRVGVDGISTNPMAHLALENRFGMHTSGVLPRHESGRVVALVVAGCRVEHFEWR